MGRFACRCPSRLTLTRPEGVFLAALLILMNDATGI